MKRKLIAAAGMLAAALGTAFAVEKPPVPANGCYVGATLDPQTEVYDFNRKIGKHHAVFLVFVKFPDVLNVSSSEYERLVRFMPPVMAAGAIPMVTLECFNGLDGYDTNQVNEFADMLNNYNWPIFLRWNHEMNGSWYPWGHQPTLYIQKFREFADIIHARAPGVAMTWTPNQCWGYPWSWGAYAMPQEARDPAHPRHADFTLMDTDHDNWITGADDPYTPYYPGDAYVDWVGHSFYHWGNGPEGRGYNQVPDTSYWARANGIGDPTTANFHDLIAAPHNKPMMIAETSAFYDPTDFLNRRLVPPVTGPAEEDIKVRWVREVYNLIGDEVGPDIRQAMPMLKSINWFNQLKFEAEVHTNVSWRLQDNLIVRSLYQTITADPFFLGAPFPADRIELVSSCPEVMPNDRYEFAVSYRLRTNRYLQVSILDPADNYEWYGGTSLLVAAGSGLLNLQFPVQKQPAVGEYLLDLMITPPPPDEGWSNRVDRLAVPVHVVTDALSWVSYPDPIRVGDDIQVSLAYEAHGCTPKSISVSVLQSNTWEWLGGGSVDVGLGSGTTTLVFRLVNNPTSTTPDPYVLNAFLARQGEGWSNATANADMIPVTVLPAPSNRLSFVSAADTVQNGQSYPLSLDYELMENGYLVVNLIKTNVSGAPDWYGGTNIALAQGSGTAHVNVQIEGYPPNGAQCEWSAFIGPDLDWVHALAMTQYRPVTVQGDEVEIVSYPPILRMNQDITVCLDYLAWPADTGKYVQVDVMQDQTWDWIGGKAVPLEPGIGVTCVTFRLDHAPTSTALHPYVIAASMARLGDDYLKSTAAAERKGVTVVVDRVWFVDAPRVVRQGAACDVTIGYALESNSVLTVDLLKPDAGVGSNFFGRGTLGVPAGVATCTVPVPVVNRPPGDTNYAWKAYLSASADFSNATAEAMFAPVTAKADRVWFVDAPSVTRKGDVPGITLGYDVESNAWLTVNLLRPGHEPGSDWYGRGTNLALAGAGTATVWLAVEDDPPGGTDYVWQAYVSPDGQASNARAEVVFSPVTVRQDRIWFVSATNSVWGGRTFDVRLGTEAESNGFLVAELLDLTKPPGSDWFGSGSIPLAAGTRTSTVSVTLERALPAGTTYVWNAFFGSTPQFTTARASAQQGPVTGGCDRLWFVASVDTVRAGRVYCLQLGYQSYDAQNLSLNLMDPNGAPGSEWFGGTNIQIAAGAHTNTVCVRVVDYAAVWTNLEWSAFIGPTLNYTDAMAEASAGPVWATGDRLWYVSAPDEVRAGFASTVVMGYDSESNGFLRLNLLDPLAGPLSNWFGGVTIPVAQGIHTSAATIAIDRNIPTNRTYQWSSFIGPTDDYARCTAAALRSPVAAAADEVWFVNAPANVDNLGAYDIRVGYDALSNGVLSVNFMKGLNWYGGGSVPVSAGRGTATVSVAIQNLPEPGTNYEWHTFVGPSTEFTNCTGKVKLAPVTVVGDSVWFVSYPNGFWTPQWQYVTVGYDVRTSRWLQCDLLTPDTYIWHGGGSAYVGAGQGSYTFVLFINNDFLSGYNYWSTFSCREQSSWATRTASAATAPFWVHRDPVYINAAPTSAARGAVCNVTLSWEVFEPSEVHIDLVLNNGTTYPCYGSAWTSPVNGVGSQTFQVTVDPAAPPATNYVWSSWVGPVGQGYEHRTDDDIRGPVRVY